MPSSKRAMLHVLKEKLLRRQKNLAKVEFVFLRMLVLPESYSPMLNASPDTFTVIV